MNHNHNQNNNNKPPAAAVADDDDGNWNLPDGARPIVLGIVAARIMELELEQMHRYQEHVNPDAVISDSYWTRMDSLVRQFPHVVKRTYEHDVNSRLEQIYPLFLILFWRPPLSVVQTMVEAHPSALLTSVGPEGFLPINIVIESGAAMETIQYVYSQMPNPQQTVQTPIKDGTYLLHSACLMDVGKSGDDLYATVVHFILDEYEGAAKKQTTTSLDYPLHNAVWSGAPPSVMERLYALCPWSAAEFDKSGLSPLHLACKCGRKNRHNYDIIEFLVRVQPETLEAESTNDEALTPLECACAHQTPQVVELLLGEMQGPLDQMDGAGALLFLAAVNNEADTVQFLCERYPFLLTHRDDNEAGNGLGDTPLLGVCRHRPIDEKDKSKDEALFRALLKHPQGRAALTMKDENGKLPREVYLDNSRDKNCNPMVLKLLATDYEH